MKETIFANNLKKFLKNNQISQTDFAKKLDISNASVSNYLSGINEPSLSFLLKLKAVYNISLDSFLTTQMTLIENTKSPEENLNSSRFLGNYVLYYYDSSSYVGRASAKQPGILKFGVISIIPSGNTLSTYGCFLKDLNEAKSLKEELDKQENPFDKYNVFLKYSNLIYMGKTETSTTQIFIFLKSFNDSSLIMFNNPPSNKIYIGGLGTVNSVSRGREHMPCIQFVLMSRQPLNLPEGEIYNLLSLDVVDISVHNETEKLLDLFKNLYLNVNENEIKLEEYQKKKIFEDSLENVVASCIESNIFRFAKISAKEDDEYYNLIKGQKQ